MSDERKVCVVTGSRADYGLLYWTMKEIAAHPHLALQVAVTGMHLSPRFGETWRIVQDDGFDIGAKVDMLEEEDAAAAMARSCGRGVVGFVDAYETLAPDLVLVLGDRFEIFAAAQTALLMGIPIAHVHGGEVTEGAVDESIRHAITKMAHLHFVSAEPHRQRVLQMGEDPMRVFTVGAPGLENLVRLDLMAKDDLARDLGMGLEGPVILVTYHPETLGRKPILEDLSELIGALEAFPEASVVITKSNADAGGRAINDRLDAFCAASSENVRLVTSLGQVRYLSLLKCADVVVGNSSSGLIEAPSVGTATVNIGDRQKGRLRGASVIDCPAVRGDIVTAIRTALQTPVDSEANPYQGALRPSLDIVSRIAEAKLSAFMTKPFFDRVV